MNTLATLGSNQFLPQRFTHGLSSALSPYHSQSRPLAGALSSLLALNSNTVSLSDAGLAMSRRANDLGNAAIDMAQDLVTNFAQHLLGDDSEGMTISFDTASVSAKSGFSVAAQHSAGPNGTTDAAAVSMEEAVSFTGSGTITTADGHKYTFEVEVHYESLMEAAAATTTSHGNYDNHAAANDQPEQIKHLHFPGSVSDLFNILDNGKLNISFQLPPTADDHAKPKFGNLMLRLLDLIESPSPILKKLTDAYGLPSTSEIVAADAQ